jgi:hypothetical protein
VVHVPPVDSRADRSAQGAVAVILLAAFVFRQIWIVPVLCVLVAGGAALGPPGNPFLRLFAVFVAPRLAPPSEHEAAATVRIQDVLIAGLLGVATLALLIDLGPITWIVALAAAGVAAVAATTGIHIGVTVRDQLRRRD